MIRSLNCGEIVSHINVNSELNEIIRDFTADINITEIPHINIKINSQFESYRNDYQLSTEEHNFKLKGSTYIYNTYFESYRTFIEDRASGMIDSLTQKVEWNIQQHNWLPRSFFHLLILDPLSLILPKYNSIILHAAALSTEHGAVLILGDSGYGKSTLCFLASRGNKIKSLSDDTVAVNCNSILKVHPIPSGFGLSPGLLNIDSDSNNILQKSKGKIYYKSIPNQRTEPQILKSIILLRKWGTEKTTFSRLNSLEALKSILDSQTTIGSPFNNIRFQLFRRLSTEVPCYELKYPEICDIEVFNQVVLMQ